MHPVRLTLVDDRRRSRLTVLFRPLLTVPHLAWLVLFTAAALPAAIANHVVLLVRGRPAGSLHRFLAAYVRYGAHVTAFLFLVANPFPGFAGAEGYPVEPRIEPPARRRRWVAAFHPFLGLPAVALSAGLLLALAAAGALAWPLTLLSGRAPARFRDFGARVVGFLAQTVAYLVGLTDAYPRWRADAEPEPPA